MNLSDNVREFFADTPTPSPIILQYSRNIAENYHPQNLKKSYRINYYHILSLSIKSLKVIVLHKRTPKKPICLVD